MVRRPDGFGEGLLPLRAAVDLEQRGSERAWLIDGLWSANGAGLLGAEPKCMKTWLALDMAVSVATGEPCLRRFAVPEPGPVLYFAAEDAEHQVRARVASIAATVGHELADIPLQFVTVPQLLLDSEEGQDLLRRCVRHVGPKLLVIDPFVRVTMSDENSASGVGEVLQFLRGVQRQFGTAVLLVHHMRKGGGNMRPGQALRGSGDLHAFGDSNLYLARSGDSVFLTAEQRGAEGFESLELELRGEGEKLALHALEFRAQVEETSVAGGAKRRARKSKRDVVAEVQALIVVSEKPLQQRAIRERLGCRMVAVSEALQRLEAEGVVGRGEGGYQALGE